MKVAALRRVLADLSSGLSQVGAPALASALSELADSLSPFDAREVSDLKFAAPLPDRSGIGDRMLSEPLEALSAFDAFIARTAKPTVRGALNDLRIFLNDRQHMTIRSFIDALHAAFSPERPQPANDASLVQTYVDALKDAKHDDERFPKLYKALSTDERLNKDDVVQIASKFAFKMAKSTSKKVALERIWKMHNASEAFAAKSRSTKGKSAA